MQTWNPEANALFLKALELPSPGERHAYLDGACAGDATLRADVESLLEASARAGNFLESPAAGLPFLAGDRSGIRGGAILDAPRITEGPGTAIGSYELLEQIGEGGFGVVFLAEQMQPVRRQVALKVLKPGMDTRQVVARFEAERQALALMDHPNIAQVFDGGETLSGRPYFVMELVKGIPITDFCDQNQLPVRARLELFVSVCQAVQHAHQKGIIHRDIKPSNILVTLHDGTPATKVIDFGIAKAIGRSLTEKTLYTSLSQMIGTPMYMSPEQAELSPLDVDTRSDIYSLGVLLYEVLTGTTPFDQERLGTEGYDEIRRIIREEEPAKPSTRISTLGQAATTVSANRKSDPKRLSRLFRGELDWIVMKALEKDRGRRYQTANDFAMDVRRYLADETVQACPPSVGYRLRKFARRNQGRLAVAAGVFLAVTVMAASIGWAVRDRAVRQAEIEHAELARRAKVEGAVRDSLNMARTLIDENKLASARQKLARGRALLGNDASALHSLAARVAAGEAELDRFQQFRDLIERAHQAETAPLLEPPLAVDGSYGSTATQAIRAGARRPALAIPFLLEALQLYGALERHDWNSSLEGQLLGRHQVEQIRRLAYEELLWLADDLVGRQQEHHSGRTLSPHAAARQALAYLDKAESAHRPTQAFYALRAQSRRALGEVAAAEADAERAVKTPATMALDHVLRGQAAYDAKKLAEGVQAFEAALRLEPTHYWSMMKLGYCLCDLGRGAEDFAGATRVFTGCILNRPDHAHAYYCRARAYSKMCQAPVADLSRAIDNAIADFSKAIDLDPTHLRAWANRGVAYAKLGQPDKAVADFSKAIDLDPENAAYRNNRGVAFSKLGQPNKAVPDFSRAVELDPTHAPAWYNRGAAYNKLDQSDKAIPDLSKAIELDPKDARAWIHRGWAYNQLGQAKKAFADYSKAAELDPKNPLAWHGRGVAYDALRQPDKAVADLSKAIELDPKYAPARNKRAMAYAKIHQADKALSDCSRAIELDPQDASYRNNRGVVYNTLNQPAKAVADFSKAIELGLKGTQPWNNRGWAYHELGQADKAVADFSKAIELDPKQAKGWNNRGAAHQTLGQLDKAVADLSKAIELDPKYANAWNNRGLAYIKLGQADKAVADSSRAIELAPKTGAYWKTLGMARYRAGDWKAAVPALEKSLELRPGGDAVARLFRAMAHRKLGNHDEAHKAYEQAVGWLEKNKEALEKDKRRAEELRRIRAEAEEVLELKKK